MLLLFIISFLMFMSFHVVSSFTFSSQRDPSHLRWGFYTPFNTFSPSHRGVIRDTLFYDHSSIFLPRAPRSCVGIIYPQAFSTLARLHRYFITCVSFIEASLGAVLPWGLRDFIHIPRVADCGPRPSVSLIHSHPQTLYQERFSFKFYHILA